MHVNGCFIDVKLDADGVDGFSVKSVTKVVDVVRNRDVPKDLQQSRGPFGSIYAALRYAQSWIDPAIPPVVPVPEPVDPMQAHPDGLSVEQVAVLKTQQIFFVKADTAETKVGTSKRAESPQVTDTKDAPADTKADK